jgi:hypothetical protein
MDMEYVDLVFGSRTNVINILALVGGSTPGNAINIEPSQLQKLSSLEIPELNLMISDLLS